MNRELHRKVRRLEGTRANQRARPRVLPFPPRSDGRPWTDEEVNAARSWRMTAEEWTEIFCAGLSHEEVEARITQELHRRIEQPKRVQR
jgi:hypothetical protein